MSPNITKMIFVPIDGSRNSLNSLLYLQQMFGPTYPMKINLFYCIPSLPRNIEEEVKQHSDTSEELRKMEKKNRLVAEQLLKDAKNQLLEKGFREEFIDIEYQQKKLGIARDICHDAEKKRVDAILLGSKSRSRIEAFLVGETANKVVELSNMCPVWLLKGSVSKEGMMIALDNSENCLRAVDHTAFMLAETNRPITLFCSRRNISLHAPEETFKEAPLLKALVQSATGKEIDSCMEKAKSLLKKSGIADNRIRTEIVNGSRNAAKDILEAMETTGSGTVVMGRRGITDEKNYTMGTVPRKLMHSLSDGAVWLVS